jgi:superfamily II DNA helicase RecQ
MVESFRANSKKQTQKWEEMKFYTRNKDFCKMKLILTYFGERMLKIVEIAMFVPKKSDQ